MKIDDYDDPAAVMVRLPQLVREIQDTWRHRVTLKAEVALAQAQELEGLALWLLERAARIEYQTVPDLEPAEEVE